jgi:predicted XRE-type DNA-binding protein
MSNDQIKEIIFKTGLKQLEIAAQIGTDESYLCRLFRKPLSESSKAKIISAIKALLIERKNEIEKIIKNMEETNNEKD